MGGEGFNLWEWLVTQWETTMKMALGELMTSILSFMDSGLNTVTGNAYVNTFLTSHPSTFTGSVNGGGGTVWSMIEAICNTAVVPIAGLILTIVLVTDLIHMCVSGKPYTEATLLSAMEHAGQDEYDEETEKKGLGTPATRAGIIEALVKNGYAERKGKQITATEKGINLIQVVPDEVKSPKLTADWEMQLQHIERGECGHDAFMQEITGFVRGICTKYGSSDSSVSFTTGNCPKCGKEVKKGNYGFYCTGRCGMNIGKVYGKELTETQVKKLLSGSSVSYTKDSKKTVVLPEVVENEYNGKTFYQWKTK